MPVVKLGKRYQVTVPKDVRNALRLRVGATLVGVRDQDRLALYLGNAPTASDYRVRVRERFQFTLPAKYCQVVGIAPSDLLSLEVNRDRLLIDPRVVLRSARTSAVAIGEGQLGERKASTFEPFDGLKALARRPKSKGRKSYRGTN